MFEKQSNNVSQIINQSFSPSLTPGGQRPISSAGANLAAANVAAASQMMPPAAPSGRNLEDIFSQTDSSALRPSAPTDSNFQPGMAPVYADSGYSGHNEQFFWRTSTKYCRSRRHRGCRVGIGSFNCNGLVVVYIKIIS